MAKAYAGFTLVQMKVIAGSLDEQLAAANARIAELCKTIDDVIATVKYHEHRAEQAEAQNKRMRVCGNCRHFEWPKCTVSGKRTTRASICREWEMV